MIGPRARSHGQTRSHEQWSRRRQTRRHESGPASGPARTARPWFHRPQEPQQPSRQQHLSPSTPLHEMGLVGGALQVPRPGDGRSHGAFPAAAAGPSGSSDGCRAALLPVAGKAGEPHDQRPARSLHAPRHCCPTRWGRSCQMSVQDALCQVEGTYHSSSMTRIDSKCRSSRVCGSRRDGRDEGRASRDEDTPPRDDGSGGGGAGEATAGLPAAAARPCCGKVSMHSSACETQDLT